MAGCGPARGKAFLRVASALLASVLAAAPAWASGDAARGRLIAADRTRGLCVLCHAVPIDEERFQGNLGPDLAGVHHTFDFTMYMLVGGLGTLVGPLLGSLAVPWLTQYLQFLQEYRFVVFGPLLIVLVIFVPNGIVGSYLAWKARRASRALVAAKPAKSPAPAAPSNVTTQSGGGRA